MKLESVSFRLFFVISVIQYKCTIKKELLITILVYQNNVKMVFCYYLCENMLRMFENIKPYV